MLPVTKVEPSDIPIPEISIPDIPIPDILIPDIQIPFDCPLRPKQRRAYPPSPVEVGEVGYIYPF